MLYVVLRLIMFCLPDLPRQESKNLKFSCFEVDILIIISEIYPVYSITHLLPVRNFNEVKASTLLQLTTSLSALFHEL